MAYKFDDPNLEKPPLVRWTTGDMWEDRQIVAAAYKMPPELVTDFHVWLYRWGEDPREIEFDPEMIAAVNKHMGRVGMGVSWDDEEGDDTGKGHKSLEDWGTAAEDLT